MKIGILTFHRAHNYGALLQAFALKRYLESKGNKVEFLDYWPKYHSSAYELIPYFSSRSFHRKISGIGRLFVGLRKILKRRRGYLKFIKAHLNVQEKPEYKTSNEFLKCTFDCIVYGSDQIWRKHKYKSFKGFDDVYFGNHFSGVKKISYAASMGEINLSKEDIDFLQQKMSNFNFISVREKELLDVIKKNTNSVPELVIDPVFLLGSSQWCGLLPRQKNKDKYVLFYQLARSADSISLANRIAGELGCQVIEIQAIVNARVIGARYRQTATPLEFLTFIRDAEFVVSTSFHGTAFSIIFEKQFYATGMGNNSGRARSLLSSLNMEDRYISGSTELNLHEKIDYEEVNEKLTSLINSSKAFINEALINDKF